jgi:TonB family protein
LNPNRTAAGNGSVDATRDDLWGTYISALNQKIDQNWQRISVTTNRQAKVRFEVDRQGQLVNLQLIQPSGDARADMTALQSIRAAAPFAPLPRGANEEMLVINFTFTYRVTALSNSAAETAGSQ